MVFRHVTRRSVVLAFLALVTGLAIIHRLGEQVQRFAPVLIQTSPSFDHVAGRDTNNSSLVNLRDFRFILNSDKCNSNFNDGSNVFILIFVHSTPDHFRERALLRNTWARDRNIAGKNVKTIFLLGETNSSEETRGNITTESEIHGDLVQGNFVDSYANLTYKHLMGLRWIGEKCNSTRFVLKADEDTFVDTFQLVRFLGKLYGEDDRVTEDTLMCHLYRNGSPALRKGKWRTSEAEYPYISYPPYCAGFVYILTPDLAARLVAAANKVPFFWIDDVYVTGMLAKYLGVRHQQFNLRSALHEHNLDGWLNDRQNQQPSKFLVASLGDSSLWSEKLKALWKKTLRVHSRIETD